MLEAIGWLSLLFLFFLVTDGLFLFLCYSGSQQAHDPLSPGTEDAGNAVVGALRRADIFPFTSCAESPAYLIKDNILAIKAVFSKELGVKLPHRGVGAPCVGELQVILITPLITQTCHHVRKQKLINFC